MVDFGSALDEQHGEYTDTPMVYASMQTYNEGDPSWVRVRRIEHGHRLKV